MLLDEKIDSLQKVTKQKITYEAVAKVLGLSSKQAAYNRVTRKQPLKDWEILKLEEAFTAPCASSDEIRNKIKELQNKLGMENKETVSIPYRPEVYLSAGYGVEVYTETAEFVTLDLRLFTTDRGNKINPAHCEIVRISGNSMMPEYRDGDRVIIDRDDTEFIDGHIFAFRYERQCFVKEINVLKDKIKCISLNKEYEPFYINKNEEFTVFGRILPRIRL